MCPNFWKNFSRFGAYAQFPNVPKRFEKILTNLGLRRQYLKCAQNILQTFQEISGLWLLVSKCSKNWKFWKKIWKIFEKNLQTSKKIFQKFWAGAPVFKMCTKMLERVFPKFRFMPLVFKMCPKYGNKL
jgi:hypothetical protein